VIALERLLLSGIRVPSLRISTCLVVFSDKKLKSFFFQIPLEEESRKYVTSVLKPMSCEKLWVFS